MPAIFTFSQPINIKIIIPTRHTILQAVAIREALLGLILNRLTRNPPVTIPTQAPFIYLFFKLFTCILIKSFFYFYREGKPGMAIPPV